MHPTTHSPEAHCNLSAELHTLKVSGRTFEVSHLVIHLLAGAWIPSWSQCDSMKAAHTAEASYMKPVFLALLPRGLLPWCFWRYTRTPFNSSHTCMNAHTKIWRIFDLCAGCIHYKGGFLVKAPWRRRELEDYEFPGNLKRELKLYYTWGRLGWGWESKLGARL